MSARTTSSAPSSEAAATARAPRQALDADIEFIGDFDVVHASGVDISEGGICFDVDEPMTFEMRYSASGEQQFRRARLVWIRRREPAGYRLGFEFTDKRES